MIIEPKIPRPQDATMPEATPALMPSSGEIPMVPPVADSVEAGAARRPRYLPPVQETRRERLDRERMEAQHAQAELDAAERQNRPHPDMPPMPTRLPPNAYFEDKALLATNKLLASGGRLGRLSYQAAVLMALFISMVVFFATLLGYILKGGQDRALHGSDPSAHFHAWFVFALGLAGLYFCIQFLIASTRRLHDLNVSGGWVLLPAIVLPLGAGFAAAGVPVVSYISATICLIFGLYLTLAPGSSAENDYGPVRIVPTFEKILGWAGIAIMALNMTIGGQLAYLKPYWLPSSAADTAAAAPVSAKSAVLQR
jgi:uncharacterized membrane protein YhaH (DUF805 family)